jgi:hypothetical protein
MTHSFLVQSPNSRDIQIDARRSRSYASGSHEHNGAAVQFGKQKGPGPDTCIRTQGQSVVDYLMGPASFEVHHLSRALHRGR